MDGQYQLLSFPIINIIHTFKGVNGLASYVCFIRREISEEKNIKKKIKKKIYF
jgi:hypothetical protein